MTAEDVAFNQEVKELIKTTKEKLVKELNRIFSVITQYTKLIDIIYLISLQRK